MDNQEDGLADTVFSSFAAFIIAMNVGQYILVPLLFPGKFANSNNDDSPTDLEHQRGVHALRFVENLWQFMINRILAYVFCRISWYICLFIYRTYCSYEEANGNAVDSTDEEDNLPSHEVDAVNAMNEDQSNKKDNIVLANGNAVVSTDEEDNLTSHEVDAVNAMNEDQTNKKHEIVLDGQITSPMSAGTDTLPLVPYGILELLEVDHPRYQAELLRTALDLVEEIPKDCSCIVTIYYSEDESLMIGKASIIRDGGLWELCMKKRRPNDDSSTTGSVEQMPSETDDRIINKFMSFLNTPPSLTIFVPVQLPAGFKLSDLRLLRPGDRGFDIVVKDGCVYYSYDAIVKGVMNDHQYAKTF